MATVTFLPEKHRGSGAMVEWLERLGYGAESRRKVEFEAGLCHATTVKLCQPSSKWVPVSNQRRIRQRKERDALCAQDTMGLGY